MPSPRRAPADPGADIARRLGLPDPQALILHLPLRYEDETHLTPLAQAMPGEAVLVEGLVVHAEVQPRPRRQLVVQVEEDNDAPQRLHFRLLHYYPSQLAQLQPGTRVRLYGEVRPGFFGAEMVHPRYRIVRADTPLSDHLTPVYPTVAGLSQYALHKAITGQLRQADLDDSLPEAVRRRFGLVPFREALLTLHHPPPEADPAALEARTHTAWRRLKFDELLAQQLSLRQAAHARRRHRALPLNDKAGLGPRLLAALPFPLTAAQQRCLEEIRRDLAGGHPMHRLLQGDVGSGKTVVAALAALTAAGAGHQAAVMAPTEILAEQLHLKFREWLTPLGVEVAWLAAAVKGKARQAALAAIADGTARVAVGTHALFQDEVRFHDLALAVVDEQHRFGVEQRLALREKGSAPAPGPRLPVPHLLMMSATPIPRSLAMSYYADLDVSVIDELPPGRTPVTTRVLSDARRGEVIARLRDYCLDGAQAYWVCPLVEESEKLQLKAAQDAHAELTAALPELRVGLVHGRLKADEKAAVMAAFKAGELHLLVATTVIEVGVDVPNAGLMVIEHAERMGLAQLHQLRGRVGRGRRESACMLLYSRPVSDTARQRLAVIRETQDGFAIAREDLRLRGPGEFLGARQSGLPLLRFADLEADADLLEQARDAASLLLEEHPEAVRRHLDRWLPKGVALMGA
ncbi:MAG TPA: ATP-dependent DNA helicase RecG [Thiobacillaceae bacterium]|nr:ATP-dependent DNA helicase RecG [Thiobacillaceae bacterium]